MVSARHARLGINNQRQLARQVIDHRNLLRQEQDDVRHAQGIRFVRMGKAGFDIAHGVVAEAADQPAAKARQTRQRRDAETFQIRADEIQRISVVRTLGNTVAIEQQNLPGIDDQTGRAGEADKRIAAETLAALDGFEQVGIRAVGQLEVDRQRRVEISKCFEGDGDAVIAFGGQTLKRRRGRFGHIKLHSQNCRTTKTRGKSSKS